jgi:hypothetical protein
VNILRPDYYSIKGKDRPHKSKVNVLSLCSFKNSVTTLSGLVNTLNDVGMTATCLVTHPDGLLECRAQKVSYIMVGEYYSDDLRKKIREDAKKVRASWWSNVHDEKFRALFTDNGVDLFDLVRPSLLLIYMVGFEYAVTLLNLFEEAFRDLDPEALLLSDDVGFAGRAFVRGAKNRVPSLNVQHGTFVDIIRYGELVSTKMAVWGEYSRKELIDYGVDPKKIVVTGMPRINMILEHIKNTKFDPVKAFKGKQIILWTPVCYTDLDSFEKINRRILNSLCKSFKENGLSSSYKIVVKIHPLDSKDLYLNLIKKMGGVDITVIQNEYNVYDLINHCKLLLTTTSTTGLEAIVLDKPLAVINMWGLEETIPYVKSGAGLLIRNERELTDLLVNLKDLNLETVLDEGRRRFKEIYLYKVDGLYDQRIVDAIKEL